MGKRNSGMKVIKADGGNVCRCSVDYSDLIKRVGDLVERLEGGLGVWVVPYFVREVMEEVLEGLREVMEVLKGRDLG